MWCVAIKTYKTKDNAIMKGLIKNIITILLNEYLNKQMSK
jgi:hypothetical protein